MKYHSKNMQECFSCKNHKKSCEYIICACAKLFAMLMLMLMGFAHAR